MSKYKIVYNPANRDREYTLMKKVLWFWSEVYSSECLKFCENQLECILEEERRNEHGEVTVTEYETNKGVLVNSKRLDKGER